MTDTSSSYLDTAAFLSNDFNPSTYANKLVLDTNNPTDTPLDLSTPLSKVLFDVQEVDTHIDTLTTQNALPIISYTRQRNDAATRVLLRLLQDGEETHADCGVMKHRFIHA